MRFSELFNNRIGFFSIRIKEWELKDKYLLSEIFSLLVVVRCECFEFDNKYEYYAYSDYFDEVKEGERIPSYEIVAKAEVANGEPVYSIKFERVK